LVICYRNTGRNPGRYLHSALLDSGVEVTHWERIDWERLPEGTDAVVVVESPLPPLPVAGTNPGVPVLFWVHHGEHHLYTNLRLQRRYGAHLVLLAHSWHLAHRFVGWVDRLPFGVPTELYGDPVDFDSRRWDVGFVGRVDESGPYTKRRELLRKLAGLLGEENVIIRSGLTPEEMASIYQQCRIVVNDGGTRHLPITMRVFEALGAGAALVTEPAPGLDLLLQPGFHYFPWGSDPGTLIRRILSSGEARTVAAAGHDEAYRRHTYRHRVADLASLVRELRAGPLPEVPVATRRSGLAGILDEAVDCQRILTDDPDLISELCPDREVWDLTRVGQRAIGNRYDAVILLRRDTSPPEPILAAASKLIVADPVYRDAVEHQLSRPTSVQHTEDLVVVHFWDRGYRLDPDR
jgi:hypothetical protein